MTDFFFSVNGQYTRSIHDRKTHQRGDRQCADCPHDRRPFRCFFLALILPAKWLW
jgi:hypothetical protein